MYCVHPRTPRTGFIDSDHHWTCYVCTRKLSGATSRYPPDTDAQHITEQVCAAFDLDPEDVLGFRKYGRLAHARRLIVYLVWKLCGVSAPKLATWLGKCRTVILYDIYAVRDDHALLTEAQEFIRRIRDPLLLLGDVYRDNPAVMAYIRGYLFRDTQTTHVLAHGYLGLQQLAASPALRRPIIKTLEACADETQAQAIMRMHCLQAGLTYVGV